MLTFQLEPWYVFWRDGEDLWREHYAEIGNKDYEMDVDSTLYQAFENAGQLQVLTARKDGRIIGYVVMLVRKHPHYNILCGFEDAYFLTKVERKGLTGVRLLNEAIKCAKVRGVKRVFFHSKVLKDLRRIFTRLGFKHSDELWAKDIG